MHASFLYASGRDLLAPDVPLQLRGSGLFFFGNIGVGLTARRHDDDLHRPGVAKALRRKDIRVHALRHQVSHYPCDRVCVGQQARFSAGLCCQT